MGESRGRRPLGGLLQPKVPSTCGPRRRQGCRSPRPQARDSTLTEGVLAGAPKMLCAASVPAAPSRRGLPNTRLGRARRMALRRSRPHGCNVRPGTRDSRRWKATRPADERPCGPGTPRREPCPANAAPPCPGCPPRTVTGQPDAGRQAHRRPPRAGSAPPASASGVRAGFPLPPQHLQATLASVSRDAEPATMPLSRSTCNNVSSASSVFLLACLDSSDLMCF